MSTTFHLAVEGGVKVLKLKLNVRWKGAERNGKYLESSERYKKATIYKRFGYCPTLLRARSLYYVISMLLPICRPLRVGLGSYLLNYLGLDIDLDLDLKTKQFRFRPFFLKLILVLSLILLPPFLFVLRLLPRITVVMAIWKP